MAAAGFVAVQGVPARELSKFEEIRDASGLFQRLIDVFASAEDFHAGLNFAGVYRVPAIFVCINDRPVDPAAAPETVSETFAVKALAYGVAGFLLGDYSARAGWLAAALIAHGCSVAVLLVALPFLGRPAAWRGTASGVLWAAAAGVADAVGLLAFSRGGQVGQVAVTAAVSSIYPVIPVVAGMMLFSERLSGRQVLGVGCIVAGLVLLGLTG
jgi:uncharacterized membrane protein